MSQLNVIGRKRQMPGSSFSSFSIATAELPYSRTSAQNLSDSMIKLSRNNDALRLSFTCDEDQPASACLNELPLPGYVEFDSADETDAFISVLNNDPDSPLCRFYIIRQGDVLKGFLKADTLIADAYSLSVVRDVLTEEAKGGRSMFYPGKTYQKFKAQEDKYLRSQAFAQDMEHWRTIFPAVPERVSLLGGEQPENDFDFTYVMDDVTLSEFLQLCYDYRLTAFQLAALCLHCLLEIYLGRDDICFCYTSNGRDTATRSIIGSCIGAIPLPLSGLARGSLHEAVDILKKQLDQTQAHGTCHLYSIERDMKNRLGTAGGLADIVISDISPYAFPQRPEYCMSARSMYPLEIFINIRGKGSSQIYFRCLGSFAGKKAISCLCEAFSRFIHECFSHWNKDITEMDIFD